MKNRPKYSQPRKLQLRKDPSEKWGINLGIENKPPFHVRFLFVVIVCCNIISYFPNACYR